MYILNAAEYTEIKAISVGTGNGNPYTILGSHHILGVLNSSTQRLTSLLLVYYYYIYSLVAMSGFRHAPFDAEV